MKKFTNSELSAFCGQLATLLKSGISLMEGFYILDEESTNKEVKDIYHNFYHSLEMGESFYTTICNYDCFPDYLKQMIAIGEQSGTLDIVMDDLSDYYSREEEIHRSIKNAIIYPCTMLIVMFLIVGILLIKVLPIFQDVYHQLGSELSGISLILLHIGRFLASFGPFIIIAIFLLALLVYTNCKKNRTVFPFLKSLKNKLSVFRFTSCLSMAFNSGLNIEDSFSLIDKIVDDPDFSKKINQCLTYIQEGSNYGDAISKSDIYDTLYTKMIAVGFRSGTVDNVLQKTAEHYQKEIDHSIERIINSIEPVLVAILCTVVGIILLSVLFPLIGIMTAIG
jgi:type IV pilus assembly protein PilC